jgi:hypothetical protein
LIQWIKRRRQHSYNQLWEMVYGGDFYNKGLRREMEFYAEIAGGWKTSYEVVKKENDRLVKEIERLSKVDKQDG